MSLTLPTDRDFAQICGDNRKLLNFFRDLSKAVQEGQIAQSLNVEATAALQDATVVTLSSNDTLNNERVIQQGRGISLSDTGNNLIVSLGYPFYLQGGYRLTFNLAADTDLNANHSGTVMVSEYPVANLTDAANDSAAAGAGVPVNGFYRTGNSVQVRLA